MKRRNFIKIMGASIFSMPVISQASLAGSNATLTENLKKADYQTGFNNIDYFITGLNRGDLVVIASEDSSVEREFIYNLLINISNNHQVPVSLYPKYSLSNFYKTLVTSTGMIKSDDYRKYIHEYETSQELTVVLKTINNFDMVVYKDELIYTCDEYKEMAYNLVETQGVRLLVVHSIDHMYDDTMESFVEYNVIIPFFKKLAVNLNIPIIVHYKLNRIFDGLPEDYPRSTDTDNYQVFLKHADTVITLTHDLSDKEEHLDINIHKASHGQIGRTVLKYDIDYMRFYI